MALSRVMPDSAGVGVEGSKGNSYTLHRRGESYRWYVHTHNWMAKPHCWCCCVRRRLLLLLLSLDALA
jgi:hypothetical protein